MPLWVSRGGGSQLRWMVLFCSWLTLMDTVCGEALGTVQKVRSVSLLHYKHRFVHTKSGRKDTFLTRFWHPEVLSVALSPVQVAPVRTNFELVLETSLQGPQVTLESGHDHLLCCPVGAGRQQRAIEDLKAV